MTTRRLIILFIALLGPSGLCAQGSNPTRDSLLVCLESLPHNELRLQTFENLTNSTRRNLEECARYNEQLFAEAEQQNNDKFKCKAYFTRVLIAYNTVNAEVLQKNVELLIPLARQTKNYDLMFRGWRCKIDFMILSQDFERNEKEAQKMLREARLLNNTIGILEAKQCLSNIYSATFRPQEAIKTLESALLMAESYGKMFVLSNIWQQLLMLYSETREYPKWISLLEHAEAYVMRLPKQRIELQGLTLLTIYTSYTDYHTQTGNLDKAKFYLDKAGLYTSNIASPLYTIYYDRICALYHYRSEQYALALDKIDLALEDMGSRVKSQEYLDMLDIKAGTLNKLGRYADAIPVYQEAITLKDSLQVAAIDKQCNQLKKDFNADQLLIEQARLRHHTQIYTLIPVAFCLLIILGFIVYTLRSHRTIKKAEAEMRDMTLKMESVNEAKNRFLSNISATLREPLNTVVEGSLRLATHQIRDHAEEQELSARIRVMSSGLLKMINDILDLSRLEAGMMKFEVTDAEVTTLLLDAISSSETLADKVEIRPEYPDNTLFMVRLDGGRLQQVFKSLFAATDENILVSIREQWDGLRITIAASALTQQQTRQDVIIRNEINRMLIVHFGGTYKIGRDSDRPAIIIYLPVNEIIKA